jgi:RNA polymerase sigma-70 factor (sigma-E family)
MGDDLDPEELAEFDDYVRTRGPRLVRVARLLVDDPDSADDLVQTVLVKILAAWPRVRRADDVDAYVRRALVNTRNSWWWRRRREVRVDEVPDRRAAGDHAEDVARRSQLAAALARLSPGQRTAVVLRYYADLDERQVADAMGCSVGTVRSQTARGLRRLREMMGQSGASPGRYPSDLPSGTGETRQGPGAVMGL